MSLLIGAKDASSDILREVLHFSRDAGRIDIHGKSKTLDKDRASAAQDVWVNVTTGTLGMAITDLDLPGNGEDELPTLFTRYYHSDRGWWFNQNMHLAMLQGAQGTVFYITDEDGIEYAYLIPGSPENAFNPNAYPAEAASKEARLHTLTLNSSAGGFIWIRSDGRRYAFTDYEKLTPWSYRYRLGSIQDRNHNTATYGYSTQGLVGEVRFGFSSLFIGYSQDGSGNYYMSVTSQSLSWQYAFSDSKRKRLVQVSSPDAQIVAKYRYVSGSSDLVSEIEDALGHKTGFEWTNQTPDNMWRVSKITDPEGNVTELSYPAQDKTVVLDPRGVRTEYTHEDLPLSWSGTVEMRSSERFVTEKHTLLSGGGTYTERFGYDSNEYLNEFRDHYGNTSRWERDLRGNILSFEDPLARKSSYKYDARGRLMRITYQDGAMRQTAYDANSNPVERTDELGRKTRYRYDALDRAIETVNPAGHSRSFAYDAAGNLVRETDEEGRVTRRGYDDLGRMIEQHDPLGYGAWYRYGPNSGIELIAGRAFKPTKTIDPRWLEETQYQYDPLGRLLSASYPDNTREEHRYDEAGNPVAFTNRLGHTVLYRYDVLDRLVEKETPLGHKTRYDYDAEGNLIALTDSDGHTTRYEYDPLGKLTAVQDPRGGRVTYGYDACGNRKKRTDPQGYAKRWRYDARNRLIKTTAPLGRVSQFTYDAYAHQTSRTDPAGKKTLYQYDALDRLKKETHPDGITTRYSYDKVGNRLSMTDQTGQSVYEYSPRNELTVATDPAGRRLEYFHDQIGQRIGMKDAEGQYTLYLYDHPGRLRGVAYPVPAETAQGYIRTCQARYEYGEGVPAAGSSPAYKWVHTIPREARTDHTYDKGGRRIRTDYPNGMHEELAYDAKDRVKRIELFDPLGTSVRKIRYHYDANDNRIGLTDSLGSGEVIYGYNPCNMLTSITAGDTATQYRYDRRGNRTKEINPAGTSLYTYNEAGELLEVQMPDGLTRTYAYDRNGNLVHKAESVAQIPQGETAFTWNDENHLSAFTVTDTAGAMLSGAYTYDGDGRQISYQSEAKTAHYLYDGLNLLAEYSGPGALRARYVTGPGLDDHVAQIRGSETRWVHRDALGSIAALSGPDGQVKTSCMYDAWGREEKTEGEPGSNEHAYAGRPKVKALGLVYCRARWYDPDLGRFISPDRYTNGPDDARVSYENQLYEQLHGELDQTLSFLDPYGHNGYIYVRNNPLKYTDPLGLIAETAGVAKMRGIGETPQSTALVHEVHAIKAKVHTTPITPERQTKLTHPVADQQEKKWITQHEGPVQALKFATPLLGPIGPRVWAKGGAKHSEDDPTVYRQGTFGNKETGWKGSLIKGQQWAADNPLSTSDYSKKYGLPAENSGRPDWVVRGRVKGGFKTRPAPASHNKPSNSGGATEFLPANPDDVKLDWFHMP